MTIITISREYGSGGSQIASELAQGLRYHIVDKDLIARILSQYGFIRFGQEYEALPGFWSRFNSQRSEMVLMLNRVILALAAHGDVVILGRGSFALLAGYADVLNVRTQAPLSVRTRRIADQQGISISAAESLVNNNDLVRSSFIESSYNVRWDSTIHFDLVINTSKVQAHAIVTGLIETVKRLPIFDIQTYPLTSEIDVSPVLKNVVSQTLKCFNNHASDSVLLANR